MLTPMGDTTNPDREHPAPLVLRAFSEDTTGESCCLAAARLADMSVLEGGSSRLQPPSNTP